MSQPAPFSTNDFTVPPVAHASTLPAPPPSDPDHDTEESAADAAARHVLDLTSHTIVTAAIAERVLAFAGRLMPVVLDADAGRPARDFDGFDDIEPTDTNLRNLEEDD